MQPDAAIQGWRDVARERELTFDATTLRMDGWVGGRQARVELGWVQEGLGRYARPVVDRAECSVTQPVPFGLRIRPASGVDTLVEWFGTRDIQIGHAQVDAALQIAADERKRAKKLLRAHPFPQVAAMCVSKGWDIHVQDEKVAIVRRAREVFPGEVRLILDLLPKLSRALIPRGLGPSVLKQIAAELGIWASEHLAKGPFRGTVVSVERDGKRYRVGIELPELLDFTIRRREERDRDGLLGDPVLDATIRVSCLHPEQAIRRLTPGLGELLELVHGRGGRVDGGILTARVPADDVAEIVRIGADLGAALRAEKLSGLGSPPENGKKREK